MEHKDTIHFCDHTDRGVNCNVIIQEIIEIYYVNDTELKGQIFQFRFNFTLKSSLPILSNRANRLSSITVSFNSDKATSQLHGN